jgi:hypothetical protein
MLQSQQNGRQHMHTRVSITALATPQQEAFGNFCHPSPSYEQYGQRSEGESTARLMNAERCDIGMIWWCTAECSVSIVVSAGSDSLISLRIDYARKGLNYKRVSISVSERPRVVSQNPEYKGLGSLSFVA